MMRLPLILLAAMLAIGTAVAATAPEPAAAPKHMKLTEIEDALKLTPAQKPLWDAFTGSIRTAGKARHDAYLQSRAAPKDLPSRIAQQAQMYAVQQKSATDEQAALMPLWAQLDDQQKTLLNGQIMISYRRTTARPATAQPATPTATPAAP